MEPNTSFDNSNPVTGAENIGFSDIFNVDDIRRKQDIFSDATGVVSLITYPDGTPIYSPGNFCRSWDACASITVGGKHVANWLIGQVLDEGVPALSVEQFDKVTKLLLELADGLSEKGYYNLQLKMQITERKRTEEELFASQQITEDILNVIPVRVFWKDRNLRYLGCNPMFAGDAGFAGPEDIIGKDDFDMGWRDLAELYRSDDLQVIMSGHPKLLIEELQTTPDGKTITLLTNKIPLRNSKEEVIGVLGTYMDITDRKQAEDLLAQTRQNYEAFFNTIDDFLFVLDEQGNIIHTNTTVTNRLGYIIEELYGKSVLMVHPPELRNEAGRIISEMLNGVTEFCLIPVITKSGVQIPVETRAFHGFWDGKPAIFGVTKDISKIKLSEEKFSKLFYINPSACGLTDLVSGKYTEVNEAFYTLFGFDKNEVIGKTPLELGLLTHETLNAITLKVNSKGNTFGVEADLKAKNGDVKHVLLSSENIFIQENKLRYTVVQDITGSKQKEAEIKRNNEELIKINAEKDKFFSIIAHDLRSPFHTLLGFTRLMVEELPTLTLDEIQKIAVSMRNSANKLFNLLENLLEWSQMQRGLRSFKPESFLVVNEIKPIIELIRDASDKKMIAISCDIPEDLRIMADAHMFESLIRNLVFNAVKFTPKGGKVAIVAKPVPNNFVEISIKDTGIGMNNKVIDNLFSLDEQSTRLGTEGEPSTGLGLIICKDFIEKHDGKLWVESEEGKGSTFYFTIPCIANPGAKSDIMPNTSGEAKEGQAKNLKILIAEDDETSEMLITRSLKKFNYNIIYVNNGVAAVETCHNNPDIDVVLMDIKMPLMDGYDATRQIRRFNSDVVIIAQTAFALTGERERAMAAGCSDYIPKPINHVLLNALIKKHVENKNT